MYIDLREKLIFFCTGSQDNSMMSSSVSSITRVGSDRNQQVVPRGVLEIPRRDHPIVTSVPPLPRGVVRAVNRQVEPSVSMRDYANLSSQYSRLRTVTQEYKQDRDQLRLIVPWLIRQIITSIIQTRQTIIGAPITEEEIRTFIRNRHQDGTWKPLDTLVWAGELLEATTQQATESLSALEIQNDLWENQSTSSRPFDLDELFESLNI